MSSRHQHHDRLERRPTHHAAIPNHGGANGAGQDSGATEQIGRDGDGEMRDWHSSARCRGQGSELFFTDDDASTRRRARAFCAGCPVWWECLTDALNGDEREGMWGGLRSGERNRLRRLRRRLKLVPQDPANRVDIALLERVLPQERLELLLDIEPDKPTITVRRRLAG